MRDGSQIGRNPDRYGRRSVYLVTEKVDVAVSGTWPLQRGAIALRQRLAPT